MLLQPRKFVFKSKHKSRRFSRRYGTLKLNFGDTGLLTLQPLKLNNKSIFRIKLFLNKSARRSEDTRRRVWLNAFPHLPLTKKTIGSRMGKGIGKLKSWFSITYSVHILIEFKNLRNGRSLYFSKQLQKRIKCFSKIVYRSRQLRVCPGFNRDNVSYQSYW